MHQLSLLFIKGEFLQNHVRNEAGFPQKNDRKSLSPIIEFYILGDCWQACHFYTAFFQRGVENFCSEMLDFKGILILSKWQRGKPCV
jgi:hypothetical protein